MFDTILRTLSRNPVVVPEVSLMKGVRLEQCHISKCVQFHLRLDSPFFLSDLRLI